VRISVELRRFLGNPALLVGLLGMLVVLVMGVFGEAIAPHDPNAQRWLFEQTDSAGNRVMRFAPTAPDREHLLGTDQLGRDQLSRLLVGARTTLTVVLLVALARLGIGIVVGLAAGWYGALGDRAIRAVTAAFVAVPQLLLAILFVLVLRSYGIAGFILALALVGWPAVAEFVRSETVRAKAASFMEAARTIGARDRWLVRRHLLTALGPQLLTLVALETGAVLLLLAELGLIGLFIGGATYYVDEAGAPVLPIRDRAPEWGQMLGGIQFYIAQVQLVVLIPAAFVALAAVSFTLLADGIRAAGDPHSPRRLLPSSFGLLAKTLAAAVVVATIGFAGFNVRTAAMSLGEGHALAAQAAEKTWPGSRYVAGVVRFSSEKHGMERPEKLTYYFENDGGEVLRISYERADPLAAEIRQYEEEDGIDYDNLMEISGPTVDYAPVLVDADHQGGSRWRLSAPHYRVRIVLTQPRDSEVPRYYVTYGTLNEGQTAVRICCYNATTGERILPPPPPLPFPIPADCPATKLETILENTGVGHVFRSYRTPQTTPTQPVLSMFTNIIYEEENTLSFLNARATPRLASATKLTGAPGPTAFNIRGGGSNTFFGVLRLDTPGCWRLNFAVGDESLEVIVYAYPFDCRPPDARLLPRASPSPCRP
jgi:peptide/nickel transport system permease protein